MKSAFLFRQGVIRDIPRSSAATVEISHPYRNEGVTAFVVPGKDAEVTEEEIVRFCKMNLGGFEVPKKIVIVEELPRTSTGKVMKNVIKSQYHLLYRD